MSTRDDETHVLAVGETARFGGGFEIEWVRHDPSDGPELEFELRDGSLHVRTIVVKGVSTLLAEGRAVGETFSLRKLGGHTVEARILVKPPPPLSDDEAIALAEQFVGERGMSSPAVTESSSSNGVVWAVLEEHHRATAHVEVGMYSHDVTGNVSRHPPMDGPLH